MNTVILHIEYLLTRHDCVVVPGLGAFINHYDSAWYDEATGVFHAPSMTTGFNPDLNHNDWMLADSISRREGVSREAAMKEINVEVRSMLCQLRHDGEFALGSIGMFEMSAGDSPLFVPSSTAASRLSALASLPQLQLSDYDTDVAPDIADDSSDEEAAGRHGILYNVMRAAACLAGILVVAAVLMRTTMTEPREDTCYASIDSGFSSYNLADVLFADRHDNRGELLIAKPVETLPVVAATTVATPAATEELHLDLKDPYLVVVASFATVEQSEKFISQHKPAKLGISFSGENYRVIAASAKTLGAAMSAASSPQVTSRFSQAWVFGK
ncbi:MAG: hypothetical protein NC098_06095 [Lachnoclostridium sp.]|nr:hypothetical protein [Lachnoclostridium sp.]